MKIKLLAGLATVFLLVGMVGMAKAAPVTFTFESGNNAGAWGVVYGSSDPQGYPALERNGFIIDVKPMGTSNPGLHFHEVDSTQCPKVPDRPSADKGVLWRDAVTGQDPVVFSPASSSFLFSLESLVVGASWVDGSGTNKVCLSAFLGGIQLSTLDLVTPQNAYAAYSGAELGAFQGLNMDRLEFVGLSTTGATYYMLDNVAFQTSPVPVPATMLLFGTGIAGLAVTRLRRKK